MEGRVAGGRGVAGADSGRLPRRGSGPAAALLALQRPAAGALPGGRAVRGGALRGTGGGGGGGHFALRAAYAGAPVPGPGRRRLLCARPLGGGRRGARAGRGGRRPLAIDPRAPRRALPVRGGAAGVPGDPLRLHGQGGGHGRPSQEHPVAHRPLRGAGGAAGRHLFGAASGRPRVARGGAPGPPLPSAPPFAPPAPHLGRGGAPGPVRVDGVPLPAPPGARCAGGAGRVGNGAPGAAPSSDAGAGPGGARHRPSCWARWARGARRRCRAATRPRACAPRSRRRG